MGMDELRFNELDQTFQSFLEELQKHPIPDYKKKEIEKKFQETMRLNRAQDKNDMIQLDMKQLNRNSNFLKSAHIQESAIRWASGLALFSAGLLFITIGFILIVTPASPEFEIATIFYFNDHDGFTVMDLFALVIIFIGIYLFIRAFIDKNK